MKLSVRWKIVLLIIAPIIGIYIAVMVFNIHQMRQWTISNVEKRMAELAGSYAAAFNGQLKEAAQIIRKMLDE